MELIPAGSGELLLAEQARASGRNDLQRVLKEKVALCVNNSLLAAPMLVQNEVAAIHEVQQGRGPCAPPVVTAVLRRIAVLAEGPPAVAPPAVEPLTSREREILALLAEGYGNKEVCHQLHITVQTVKNHVHNILTKLQVHRRRDAVRLALELDLLQLSGEEAAGPIEGMKE